VRNYDAFRCLSLAQPFHINNLNVEFLFSSLVIVKGLDSLKMVTLVNLNPVLMLVFQAFNRLKRSA
jgi:hypothetical protein